jgi:hypothetical protein
MASSILDKKILPSPILPVFAVFKIVAMAFSAKASGSTISSLTFGSRSYYVFAPPIHLRVTFLASLAPYFRHRHALHANFEQCLFHRVKS